MLGFSIVTFMNQLPNDMRAWGLGFLDVVVIGLVLTALVKRFTFTRMLGLAAVIILSVVIINYYKDISSGTGQDVNKLGSLPTPVSVGPVAS